MNMGNQNRPCERLSGESSGFHRDVSIRKQILLILPRDFLLSVLLGIANRSILVFFLFLIFIIIEETAIFVVSNKFLRMISSCRSSSLRGSVNRQLIRLRIVYFSSITALIALGVIVLIRIIPEEYLPQWMVYPLAVYIAVGIAAVGAAALVSFASSLKEEKERLKKGF